MKKGDKDDSKKRIEMAKKYTYDSKLFISSLADAYKCTKQIGSIDTDRLISINYTSKFKNMIDKKEILLHKKETDNSIVYLTSLSKDNFYVYNLYKHAFIFYARNIIKIDECSCFDDLNNLFGKIESGLKDELRNKVNEFN